MSDQHPIHIAKSLEYGWDVLSKRWLALVLWTIILSVPYFLMYAAMLIFVVVSPDHRYPQYFEWINVAVNLIPFMLYTKVALLCMDDEPADLGSVLGGFRFLIPFAVASFLFYLAVFLGTCALIIPGIYFGLSLGLYPFLVVDQFMGPIEALKRSWAITRGHLKQLVFLVFVLCMVIFGGLICFVVGVIPASIVSTVALADVYRRLDQAYDQLNEESEASALEEDESEPEEEIAG